MARTDWTTPMILLVGAGAALFAYQQGWFSGIGGGGGGEVYGQSEFESTGMSTLCKCGTANAVHVGGDCNSCKASCQERCGNCSPQCISSGSAKKTSTMISTLCKCGAATATHVKGDCNSCKSHCRSKCGVSCPPQCLRSGGSGFAAPKPVSTSAKGSPAIKAKINAAANAPKKPLQSTLCKCGSATAKHIIGTCNTCRSSCRARCGNCSPQCMGTRSNLASEGYDYSPALMGAQDTYTEPLYFSGVGAVEFPKTYGVVMSVPAVGNVAGPW